MIIGPLQHWTSCGKFFVQAEIQYGNEKKNLWYSVDEKYSEHVCTEQHDAFVVGCLLLGMSLGEDMHIEGALSEKLFYNLSNYYINIITRIIPSYRKIKLEPQRLANNRVGRHGGVATGFSGGVDSFSVLHDHLSSETPESYRLTHLFFNNVGSHGEWDSKKASDLFEKRFALIEDFARQTGLEFIKVDSNLSDILQMNFEQTHVPRNASAVLLMQKLVSRYYYSSGFSYEDSFVAESSAIAHADPIAVPLLSTETLEFIPAGAQYSRVDKTQHVAALAYAHKWLNVCISPKDGRNCAGCTKCCRTLFTLELLGQADRFAEVFDMETWKWARKWYVPEVILNRKVKESYVEEIRAKMKEQGKTFTLRERAHALLVNVLPARAYSGAKRFYGQLKP